MTQAISLAQVLEDKGHTVSSVFLGKSPQRKIPGFVKDFFGDRLRYFNSPNFIRTSDRKGIQISLSFAYNLLRSPLYIYEILRLSNIIRNSECDAVVNFYDMIGGLAYFFSFSRKPFFVISHHYFLRHPDFVFPSRVNMQKLLLHIYSAICALGTRRKIALSFSEAEHLPKKKLFVVPPLLRKEIYQLRPDNEDYILVYLLNPGFLEEIRTWCVSNTDRKVIAFTDGDNDPETLPENLRIEKFGGNTFLNALAGCGILVCTAGFETVAEAAYLGKKIVVIPSKNHFEQECNAADAERAGIAVKAENFGTGIQAMLSKSGQDCNNLRTWFERNPEMICNLVEI